MKLTERDLRLVRDLALSRVLSRDQLLGLRYFGSVRRCNGTMQRLCRAGYARGLETPFFSQRLYVAGRAALDVLDPRLAALVPRKRQSPAFLRHALTVTEARIALASPGKGEWRFEAQVAHEFRWGNGSYEVKPDGLVLGEGHATFLEVDLGHTASAKWARRLEAYRAYVASGTFASVYGTCQFRMLCLTTGALRARRLEDLAGGDSRFGFKTCLEAGVRLAGAWS